MMLKIWPCLQTFDPDFQYRLLQIIAPHVVQKYMHNKVSGQNGLKTVNIPKYVTSFNLDFTWNVIREQREQN